MSADTMAKQAKSLFDYNKHWASCFEPAPHLPMTRAEMDALGWDRCDFIIVTGDAYVDHPSFGMAIIGRLVEAQGFRVGIIAQPDWNSKADFERLGEPVYAYGVAAGNMDSMINRYTADKKIRRDDAYTPGGEGGSRPDRASLVYAQRCKEAFAHVPVILGGIEASLRRIAHYDYWQEKVRRSILLDAKADVLLYGNSERALVEIMHGLARGETLDDMADIRGAAFKLTKNKKALKAGMVEIASNDVDTPGRVDPIINPYVMTEDVEGCAIEQDKQTTPAGTAFSGSMADYKARGFVPDPVKNRVINQADLLPDDTQAISLLPSGSTNASAVNSSEGSESGHFSGAVNPESESYTKALKHKRPPKDKQVIRLPSFDAVKDDPVLYAHASRILHMETNPGNARPLVQAHGDVDVWLNAPPIPLSTEEMDYLFDLPYARTPHPSYGDAKIPAFDMIRHSVNIMRGCFGGCTFCSITEHEGRIIQNRSEDSILREVGRIRDTDQAFTGVISDLGGPTANMYRLACKDPEIEKNCRKPSCVYPGVCENLGTDHGPLTTLYQKARELDGVKKVLIASGLRYDLAILDENYVRELVTHHVGGYLKIAPEHTESGALTKMMKPGIGTYDRFKDLFERFTKEAGKKQFLIPYFIAAHPGTSDYDMMNLALWLKTSGFKADQVQTFYPSPMATATAMYHSGKNPLRKVERASEEVDIVRGEKRRRLHKAFLRWHDADNWPLLREALQSMGRGDLIGNSRHQLIPTRQPAGWVDPKLAKGGKPAGNGKAYRNGPGGTDKGGSKAQTSQPSKARKPRKGDMLTQHTGLPPRKKR